LKKKRKNKKKIFFEGFGEKRKELKKVKEIATTIQKLSGENEISETEKDLIETAKKLEEEQEEFVETLIPKSFLETKKITIDNKEYSFDQLTKGLDMNKPYSLEIKSDEIMIIINTNYPFFEELKKDFSLYTKMITLTALAEAIEKIKKKPTGFILNRLFEQYGNQLNQIEELKNEDIEEIDNNLFKIVF
jgi:hypothetical protein